MPDESSTIDPNETHLTGVQKLLLFVGAIVCYAAWYFIAGQTGLPSVPHFSTSLLDSQPTMALVTVAIAMPILSVLVSLITYRVRTEAGLFCAAIGLTYLAGKSGDTRSVLLVSGNSYIFLYYMIELGFLGVVVLATYELLNKISLFGFIAEASKAPKDDPDSLADRITTIVGQIVCMLVLMMLLGQSPVKGQSMAAVCAAGLLSSLAMHQTYKVRGCLWYLVGTLLAGIIAYGYCYLYGEGFAIGEIRGLLAGAGRSLPLHYASLGVAGTIFGYWTSLSWHAARNDLLANA